MKLKGVKLSDVKFSGKEMFLCLGILILVMILFVGFGRENADIYTNSPFSDTEIRNMNLIGIGIENESFISSGQGTGSYYVKISDAQELVLRNHGKVKRIEHPITTTTTSVE